MKSWAEQVEEEENVQEGVDLKEKKKVKKEKKRKQDTDGEETPKKKKKLKVKEEANSEDSSDDSANKSVFSEPKKTKKTKVKEESKSEDSSEDASKVNGESAKKKKKKSKEVKSEESSEDVAMETNGNGVEPPPEPPAEGDFSNFRISEETIGKLKARGVTKLFPVQHKTFDFIYDGNDVIVQARTGTGKTFAFGIPLIERLQVKGRPTGGRPPKVLVMAPTRELAKQVGDDFASISDLSVLCVYGGTPYYAQENQIRRGVDVIVGTPGRIKDFVEKGTLQLDQLKYVVLDEVDRMLDMGFADSVDEILRASYDPDNVEANPQTLMFSATLPAWVYQTAQKYLRPTLKKVDMVGDSTQRTATTVEHLAIKCNYQDRAATIGVMLQVYSGNSGRAMVFCQTKRDADELSVSSHIKQETHVLHGDVPQDKREMVLKGFREGRYKCLVTTDVAARGLDVPEVDLVIQCSPPKDVESYIHRSGRTGRAGRTGTCVCFFKPYEEYELAQVERRAGVQFRRVGCPTHDDVIKTAAKDAASCLDQVSEAVLAHFREAAEAVIAAKGATDALAAALAYMSGQTEVKSRSLISSQEGYTTYLFKTNIEMRGAGYVWRTVEKQIPEEIKEKIMRMRFTADKMGCVFDLPTEHDSVIEDRWTDGKFDSLEKATELPPLLEDDSSSGAYGGRGGARGGGRGGFGSRGGFRGRGGSGGGGGRGRGGFRGRGGGGFGGRISNGFSNGAQNGASNKRTTFD